MLTPSSRYQSLAATPARFTNPDGQVIPYLPRRLIPPSAGGPTSPGLPVSPLERLDQVAARVLGDSEQFWRLCDANAAMNPFDLLEELGYRVRVPSPYDAAQWTSSLAVVTNSRLPNLALPSNG